jgi:uracil phosphoribosyltransferase
MSANINTKMVEIFDHPVIDIKLAKLRDKHTPPQDFRRILFELAGLMSASIFRHIQTVPIQIETPLETTKGVSLPELVPTIVSILRAGNGMADALSAILPEAAIGHMGLQRDPVTHKPEAYYEKLPPQIHARQVIMTDPMLATGGSAIMTADRLKELGVRDIVFCCLVAAPEGVTAFCEAHPDIRLIIAALDRELNDQCYILPGLGDAGDRIYNT